MLEVSEAEVASLKEQAAMASTEGLTRILEVLADAEIRLRDAASKKILIEITLLKAIEARSAVSLDVVLRQLQQLRGEGNASATPAPTASVGTRSTASPSSAEKSSGTGWNPSFPSPAPASPQPAALAEASAVSNFENVWPRLVEAVTHASRFTGGYLINAHLVSFAKNVFTIGFDPEFEDQLGLVDKTKSHTLLQTKLAELGHPNAQIKFIKAEAPVGRVPIATQSAPAAPSATPKPAALPTAPNPAATTASSKEKLVSVPFNKDDFKNDPLIQKALEIFKGQIVEVRA